MTRITVAEAVGGTALPTAPMLGKNFIAACANAGIVYLDQWSGYTMMELERLQFDNFLVGFGNALASEFNQPIIQLGRAP